MLLDDVERRVAAMEASHGAWPCRAGCDACCRSLGAVPSVTEAELDQLWPAIEALPDAPAVFQRIEALPSAGPIVCPLLDEHSGRCRVYAARPVACRTYGFYAGRDGDYWCDRVTAHVGDRRDTLIAGNQLAVDRTRDHHLGPSIDLVSAVRRRRRTERLSDG